ncbi:MAG: hypothetical protein AAB019_01370 [Planctomycetota bacterium]
MPKTASKLPENYQQTPDEQPGSIWSVMSSLGNDVDSNIQIDIERLAPALFQNIPIRGLVDQLAGLVTHGRIQITLRLTVATS